LSFLYLSRVFDKMTKRKVYNKIKAIIAEEGKSNKELADLLKVSEQTVSRWCTNARQPSIEKLYEIAKALKRDVRDFLVPNP
jgi:putative transcriptional regulator